MKKMKILASIMAFLVFLTACGSKEAVNQKSSGIRKITPADAKERMDAEKGIILLDVRTPEEYEEEHIPGSILLPVDKIGEQAKEELPDKDAVIFVYCASGNRSAAAAQSLSSMGYTNVYDLGGIKDWPYEKVSNNE